MATPSGRRLLPLAYAPRRPLSTPSPPAPAERPQGGVGGGHAGINRSTEASPWQSAEPLNCEDARWAWLGSNQRLLPCEASAAISDASVLPGSTVRFPRSAAMPVVATRCDARRSEAKVLTDC